MIERVLVCVEKLIHVASDRIPQVKVHAQNYGVPILHLNTSVQTYYRASTVPITHSESLHRDMIDAEIIAALNRREAKRYNSTEL